MAAPTSRSYLPRLLEGRVETLFEELPALLIVGARAVGKTTLAVNGVIGGVSGVFPLQGHDRLFATMVVPSRLEEGENAVEPYRVEREAGTVVLREES